MKDNQGNLVLDVNDYPIGQPYRSGELTMPNGGKLARNYWMVEVTFSTPASVPSAVQVPLNPFFTGFLLNAFYWSLEAYSIATIVNTLGGNTVVPQAAVNSGFITLFDGKGGQFWNTKPLRDLQTINDTANKFGKQYVDNMGGVWVNWANSYIQFVGANLIASTNYTLPLGLSWSTYANWQQDGLGIKDSNQANVNK